MPSYAIVGNQLTTLLEQVEASLTEGDDGIVTATAVYLGKWPGAIAQAEAILSFPDYPSAKRLTFQITRQEAEIAKVVMQFRGPVVVRSNAVPKKRYSLQGTTGAEPIETHPHFSEFGGKPRSSDGTNEKGATFDKMGKFIGFMNETTAKMYYPTANQNKTGVKSFLAPGLVYTEKTVHSTINIQAGSKVLDVRKLGLIDSPPDSSLLPKTLKAENWLLIGVSAEEVGDGVSVTKSWKLSGKVGWDKDIYKAEIGYEVA